MAGIMMRLIMRQSQILSAQRAPAQKSSMSTAARELAPVCAAVLPSEGQPQTTTQINILLEPDEPSDSAHESMTGKDSACTEMPASLGTSHQRCNNLHKAVVAQNHLTWQTLIHILTFLMGRVKGEGTDTPILGLYFFTRTKFTGNFSQQRREWTAGGLQVCALPQSKR